MGQVVKVQMISSIFSQQNNWGHDSLGGAFKYFLNFQPEILGNDPI